MATAVSDECFAAQFERIADNYLGGTDQESVHKRRRLFAEFLGRHEWITDRIFRRAVQEMLDTLPRFLPSLAEFQQICVFAAGELERQDQRETLALPPPGQHVVAEIDPQDPYSCTPEERIRWAREDAWCREYAKRLRPLDGEALTHLPAEDRQRVLDQQRRDQSIAAWPGLTPAARRAKERRIAVERDRAKALLAGRLDRQAAVFLGAVPPHPAPEGER